MKTATKTSTRWNKVQLGSTAGMCLCSEKNTFSQRETFALSQWEVILRPWYVLPNCSVFILLGALVPRQTNTVVSDVDLRLIV